MTGTTRSPLTGYLAFVVIAAAITLVVALVGQTVALRRGGEETAAAWRLGCGVCLAASLFAGLVVAASGRLKIHAVTMALGSMLVRLVVLGLFGAGVVTALSLQVRPFLLAVATCYLALLVIDTGYALYASNASSAGERSREPGSL